ncbi:MAG: aminoglycoside phosphotransferase family protein [Bacteroidales bacterium]|nr:aminoglycoside phosphotransferase family protein [Bacteroidales bacterium]
MPETKPGSAPADESTGSATKPDEYWACFTFIPDTFTYEHADSLELIQSGGEGVGMFHSQLSDFQGELVDTLPGFHNIKYRFKQFSETLAKKRTGRLQEVTELVEEINKRKEQMGAFWQLIEDGAIPKRISHNDTKLSNFLFDKDGRVVCAIDLDTVMQATVLFDFGDAIRSYANRFPEDHPNFEEVAFVPERFAAFSKGYLRKAAWFLNEQEKTHLAFSALYITYEQYLRFLMDYIDGDTYYRIRYPNHNLIRARSQLALLKSMEEQYSSMQNILQEIFNTL